MREIPHRWTVPGKSRFGGHYGKSHCEGDGAALVDMGNPIPVLTRLSRVRHASKQPLPGTVREPFRNPSGSLSGSLCRSLYSTARRQRSKGDSVSLPPSCSAASAFRPHSVRNLSSRARTRCGNPAGSYPDATWMRLGTGSAATSVERLLNGH